MVKIPGIQKVKTKRTVRVNPQEVSKQASWISSWIFELDFELDFRVLTEKKTFKVYIL